MASRSHVDVNERRLRPIYDCLDNGNNKKAIQEVDKVLKKQKDLTCAKVLKALALLRMGKHSEGSSILSSIHDTQPSEEQTLNAMSICYKEMQQYKNIASLYEAAAKKEPSNEDILSCLFMAHVRLGNYQQQQRTAMLLHKLRPSKNPYYFWAVMSIVMQAHKDPKLGKSMYLPLAEKMTQKYIQEKKIEAEAEILLYLIILELQEKWEEAITVLEGPLGAQLGNEINLRERRLANVCTQLGKWDRVNCIYKQQLNKVPDDWTFWLKYLESGCKMVDQGYSGEDNGHDQDESLSSVISSEIRPDSTVQSMKAFIEEKIEESKEGTLLRGPYLAQLEFQKQLMSRKHELAGSAQTMLQEYFERFGHKSCCFGDMKLYVDLLTDEELTVVLQKMKENVDLVSDNNTIKYAQDVKQLTRHLVFLQISRYTGRHGKLTDDQALALSKELLSCFWEGLKFGKELLQTDLQYSDNYLLLAIHLLLDVWKRTGDDIYVWRAIVHLELGVRESGSNFQFKLLLIQLYCNKGVFGPCPALYDSMEIKHIMNDTMGHIVSNHVVRLGHFIEASTMYTTMVRFFVVNQKEASEHLMSSYKFGSFGRIQEFVEFQDRLDNSLQYHSASTEKLLLDLIMQTDRHDATETAVDYMNRHPNTSDKLDLPNIRDNRDLRIALSWDPPSGPNSKENQENSLEEEKAWLQFRWLQLQILLAAVWVGQEPSPTSPPPGNANANANTNTSIVNGNQESEDHKVSVEGRGEDFLSVMKERERELQEFASHCSSHFMQPRQYNLCQGPFRTRISTYLGSPQVHLLSAMVRCVEYSHSLRLHGLEKSESKGESCWTKVEELANDLVVKDVQGLLKDFDGRRQLDSAALEQLVASVECIAYLTLLSGVCSRLLKPLKNTVSKKSKKNKAQPQQPQVSTFDNFNHLVLELSRVTKELHQTASGLDPVFSSLDIASLRLADIPEEEELQREAERLVWSKVECSVQQSSREICELLHHKQFYLNTLML